MISHLAAKPTPGISTGKKYKTVLLASVSEGEYNETMNGNDLSMAETNVRLVVKVSPSEALVEVKRNDKVIDTETIDQPRELAERLLPVIDTVLSRQNIRPEDVGTFEVQSNLPEGYSSRRIAETTANVWMAARKV